MKKIKPGMVPGADEFSGLYYKSFEDELLQPLQNTMNSTLQGGKMQEGWKEANIAIIPKGGQDLILTRNYKPTSLLTMTMLFTMILADRLK